MHPETAIDITDCISSDGRLHWDIPEGDWLILRTGYTLTGHPWSKWHAYPKGDTFEGGDGYEIDYLSTGALDDHFDHLGKLLICGQIAGNAENLHGLRTSRNNSGVSEDMI